GTVAWPVPLQSKRGHRASGAASSAMFTPMTISSTVTATSLLQSPMQPEAACAPARGTHAKLVAESCASNPTAIARRDWRAPRPDHRRFRNPCIVPLLMTTLRFWQSPSTPTGWLWGTRVRRRADADDATDVRLRLETGKRAAECAADAGLG